MIDDKVSIIVPIYNCFGSLERCINSITNQTYQNIEIIAVDDGSSDGSEEIIDILAQNDDRIKVFHNKNQGVSATRNYALEKASGKYIQFVDSDDFLPPYSTETMVSGAIKTGAEMVICDFYRVIGTKLSVKGKIKSKKVFSLKDYGDYMMKNPADYYYGVLWNKLYRKSIIDKNNLRMLQGVNWCEDFLFNLEYVKCCNIFYAIQIPIYYYVKTENSLSNGNLNPKKVANMKYQTFIEYNNFYQEIFSEEEYQATKPKIYRYLIESASDGGNNILHQQLGQENMGLTPFVLESNSDFISNYRYVKLYSSFFAPLTHKYKLSYLEILILDLMDSDVEISRDDLMNILSMSRQQLAIELQMLQFKGYINYNGYKPDKTTYDISFTNESVELIKSIRKIKKDFLDVITADLSEQELLQYQDIKKKVDNSIKQRLENISMLSNDQ